MINFFTTLSHALLICIPFTVFVLITFWKKPRLWLHSLPEDIQNLATPKTKFEIRQTKTILLPIMLMILPGLSVLSAIYASQNVDGLSLIGIFVHLYLVWAIIHIWDFFIIDCGFCYMIDLSHPPIKGTEGAKGWKNYTFHLLALRKALAMTLVFVVPATFALGFFL